MNTRSSATVPVVLALGLGMAIGFVSMWAATSPRHDDAICYDTTRVLEDNKPVRCERPDQLMLERPLGYGRALVTCSCMSKPTDLASHLAESAKESLELTDEEKKMLEAARDAGELDALHDAGPP